MNKRIVSLLLAIILVISLCGCSTNNIDSQPPEEIRETQNTPSEPTDPAGTEETAPAETETPVEMGFSFEDVAGLEFYFSSGAGGWRTILHINADGSFNGVYSDSEMGSVGEDYPNGTYYLCNFTGSFTTPEKLSENIYTFQLKSLEYMHSDAVEIKNGVRYVSSTPFGIEGGTQFNIFLPNTPLSEIPEEYIDWVGRGYFSTESAQESVLPFYGLFNVTEGFGFSSYKLLTPAEMIAAEVKSAEESAAVIEETLKNSDLNQTEMNATTHDLYIVWDNALNAIWQILKDNLDSATMSALTNEEIEWINEKEAATQEAGKEYEGGSIYATIVNSFAAEYTRDRVYVLAEYANLIP